MIIYYYKKSAYGVARYYCADHKIAQIVTTITGKKTLSEQDIVLMTQLGIEFMEVQYEK